MIVDGVHMKLCYEHIVQERLKVTILNPQFDPISISKLVKHYL